MKYFVDVGKDSDSATCPQRDGGGGCWLVEEQDGAAWRGSSPLAGAQLVLNHSERSASAFHSQLTSGLCEVSWELGLPSPPHQRPPPPPLTSHPACRCVICSQERRGREGRGRGLSVTCQPHECMRTASRAKARAELPTASVDPSVRRLSPDSLQPLAAALCQHVCVCVCERDL